MVAEVNHRCRQVLSARLGQNCRTKTLRLTSKSHLSACVQIRETGNWEKELKGQVRRTGDWDGCSHSCASSENDNLW